MDLVCTCSYEQSESSCNFVIIMLLGYPCSQVFKCSMYGCMFIVMQIIFGSIWIVVYTEESFSYLQYECHVCFAVLFFFKMPTLK